MKTRYYIEGKELLTLSKHVEECFNQDLSPFHFDFLTTIYEKLKLTTSQKFFISEKQSQILHQILVNYVIEDRDVSLGLFFKKEEI